MESSMHNNNTLESLLSSPILQKVISGGQSGADRAALEAAHAIGIPTGGWAPEGYKTINGNDFSLRDKFNLIELKLTTGILF